MNKKVLIAVIVFVVLLLAGGGYFFVMQRNAQLAAEDQGQQGIPDEVVPTMAPGSIGLTMVARSDNRGVKLILNNATDVKSIEFELVYDADQSNSFGEDEGGVGKISRNVGDELQVNGTSPFSTKFYDLGSCSSGKCHYDTGVTEVKLEMKVTKKDGKVFQVSDSLKL